MPGFLLQSMDFAVERRQRGERGLHGRVAVTNVSIQEIHLKKSTTYLPHIAILLKLRWLLRLHSACSELNYKVLATKQLVLHLQHLILQEKTEAMADSMFQTKYSSHVGSHLSLNAVLEDIFDQLKGSLGGSWKGFCEFVASCSPRFALAISDMDGGWKHGNTAQHKVVENDSLAMTIDTIFLTNFLRQRRDEEGGLQGLLKDMESLGIPPLQLPTMQGARNLLNYGMQHLGLLSADQRAALRSIGQKSLEKQAQCDAVMLCAELELQSYEVVASGWDDDDGSSDDSGENDLTPMDRAPTLASMRSMVATPDGKVARAVFVEKPEVKSRIFKAAILALRFYNIFPKGIRDRLWQILAEDYNLTAKQTRELQKAPGLETDGKRLTQMQLNDVEDREKARLHQFMVDFGRNTSHCLMPPLVQSPSQAGRSPEYTNWKEKQLMTQSLPSLRPASSRDASPRPPWKTWKGSPLTVDSRTGQFKVSGYFEKLAPLRQPG
ncbi:unnamed protein product [Prorocentrum cordatum]|uniref:Uncharacterized protein n=1 Tax=Prorocentrum cordatum TaxID=2364126 RepID=A0ABN9WBE7_9DINO|nr:unnamed protein product [Polarella glacialis]